MMDKKPRWGKCGIHRCGVVRAVDEGRFTSSCSSCTTERREESQRSVTIGKESKTHGMTFDIPEGVSKVGVHAKAALHEVDALVGQHVASTILPEVAEDGLAVDGVVVGRERRLPGDKEGEENAQRPNLSRSGPVSQVTKDLWRRNA